MQEFFVLIQGPIVLGDAISPTLVSVFLKFLLSNVTSCGEAGDLKTTKWASCLQWELLNYSESFSHSFFFFSFLNGIFALYLILL